MKWKKIKMLRLVTLFDLTAVCDLEREISLYVTDFSRSTLCAVFVQGIYVP